MHGTLGLLFAALIGADGPPPPPPSAAHVPGVEKPAETLVSEVRDFWGLSLPEAIRISLDNAEVVRLIRCTGPAQILCEGQPPVPVTVEGPLTDDEWDGTTPLIIGRVQTDVNIWRFKAEVMAHIRSVEQQYWSLAQQHTQLEASEKAVALTREILKIEEADLSSTLADLAETRERLEQFRLDLITKTCDIVTTERQLRNIMGLPASDRRRIVPISDLIEERREPDWNECLATMLEQQPDIVRQREIVSTVEALALEAMDFELDAAFFGTPSFAAEAAEETRQALDVVERQRAYLKQVLHQTTHSLARFFLEIDANYKQLQASKRVREASLKRLEVQRKFYDDGRITVDRYVAAVSQYASAIAQEAQFKTTYNIALVALEEVKGTLLSAKTIFVAVGPKKIDPFAHPGGAEPPLTAPGARLRAN